MSRLISRFRTPCLVLVLSSLVLASCKDRASLATNPIPTPMGQDSTHHQGLDATAVLRQDAAIAFAVYRDAHAAAIRLEGAVADLLARPGDDTLLAARAAWRDAREPYGLSEVYRFRLGPIDSSDGVIEDGPEPRINAWPIGEAFVDYVATRVDGEAGPEAAPALPENLILSRDSLPEITPASVAQMNQLSGDERNVATGYHAIEFLLWGQDLNQNESSWDGVRARDATAGQRPWTDFAIGSACTSGAGHPQPAWVCQRRGAYLLAISQLLVSDLDGVAARWNPDGGDHVSQVLTSADAGIARVFTSMGRLGFGELAGERINIPLTQNSQEDEQSCFSDNTHRDILQNARAIRMAFQGRYERGDGSVIEGPSLRDWMRVKGQASLADQLAAQLDATVVAAEAIDRRAAAGEPFDRQIEQGGINDPALSALIAALIAQTETIEAAMTALGMGVNEMRLDSQSGPR